MNEIEEILNTPVIDLTMEQAKLQIQEEEEEEQEKISCCHCEYELEDDEQLIQCKHCLEYMDQNNIIEEDEIWTEYYCANCGKNSALNKGDYTNEKRQPYLRSF